MKERCYTTLVRPSAEYASQVWDPHYRVDVENLEKIQKRAARWVTNNYRMETGNTKINLQNLGWKTLEERRLQSKIITFQKARQNLLDLPLENLKFKTRRTRLGGDCPAYGQPFSPVDGHTFSYFPQTTQLWNHLPSELKMCNEIDEFTS